MEIGFIGSAKWGSKCPRLVEAGNQVVVFDTRREAIDRLTALGAQAQASVRESRRPGRRPCWGADCPRRTYWSMSGGQGRTDRGQPLRRFVDLRHGRQ